MKPLTSLVAILLLSVAAGGCGDDGGSTDDDAGGGTDSAAVDAQPDALMADCTPMSGTDVTLEVVATGLTDPVLATSPPGDPRLFILEQPGRIRIVKDGELVETPFLDIVDRVRSIGNEEGLLGLAFHPDYAQNGRFFINYIDGVGPRATIIAEYHVSADDPDVADRTEKVILQFAQPASNHNGGITEFGPDGLLYIGVGDSGGADDPGEDAEDNTTLLGSILRLDIDGGDPYAIPAGNPYADSPNGPNDPRPEIWAYGLRNPWRFSFDRQTGDLFIGDVGQNAIEEIDVQPAGSPGGENYGWDVLEGTQCHEPSSGCNADGTVPPVTEFAHVGGNCSVTGGYVYRGACMPDVQGRYFYADYCSDRVWTFEYVGGEAQNEQEITQGGFGQNISSFGQDATGEIYVVNLQPGTVSRIVLVSQLTGR